MVYDDQDDKKVATVGAPTTNSRIHLNVSGVGRGEPLVGKTVAVRNQLGESEEIAIGTITEVETRNKWHEDVTFVGAQGDIVDTSSSGDGADVRFAEINLQAAWNRKNGSYPWAQSGPFLKMSPATGTPVLAVNQKIVSELVADVPDLHYCGHLAGTNGVPLPLNMPDFSGPIGAWSSAIFGRSGSGKTAMASLTLATLMRHQSFGILAVDPQGQFSSESGMVLSLQSWAAELGRAVHVRRISEDLRLGKDAGLLSELLKHTKLAQELGLKSKETNEIVFDEVKRTVREMSDWETKGSEKLLKEILESLAKDDTAERIYSTSDRRTLFVKTVLDTIANPKRFADVLVQFQPIHNLFQQRNAHGGVRHGMWETLQLMFDRSTVDPAPYIVLDMSSKPPPTMETNVTPEMQAVYEVLDSAVVKAAILRNIFATLKRASEQKFRDNENLNTLIVLDEAWRYAAPPSKSEDEEIQGLSNDLAGYARDTRKFGIGWMYISQSPHPSAFNEAIWQQLSVRFFGSGLTGNDLTKVGEVVSEMSALRLYKAFGDPRATGKYSFLLTGPVSPLVATNSPIVLEAFTDFDDFRESNYEWVLAARDRLGLPLLTGLPQTVGRQTVGRVTKRISNSETVQQIIKSNRTINENREATGAQNPDEDPFFPNGRDE